MHGTSGNDGTGGSPKWLIRPFRFFRPFRAFCCSAWSIETERVVLLETAKTTPCIPSAIDRSSSRASPGRVAGQHERPVRRDRRDAVAHHPLVELAQAERRTALRGVVGAQGEQP